MKKIHSWQTFTKEKEKNGMCFSTYDKHRCKDRQLPAPSRTIN